MTIWWDPVNTVTEGPKLIGHINEVAVWTGQDHISELLSKLSRWRDLSVTIYLFYHVCNENMEEWCFLLNESAVCLVNDRDKWNLQVTGILVF